jgi:subtilisin
MRKRYLATTMVLAIATLAGCEQATPPGIEETPLAQQQARLIPDQYIVVFNDAVTDPPGLARAMAVAHGLELRHTYAHALKGFAAVVPAGRLAALRADPRVRYVTPDAVHHVHQQGELPTGIDRIEADLNASLISGDSVDADIAILDTGIDPDHPDLYQYRMVSFAGGNPTDGFGHGTHVAGTAAALDDGAGVVGVAPGARIWAVKVCNNGGNCSVSDVVAGIDYVAQHADEIDVANMSLGGVGSDDGSCGRDNDDPEHQAICTAVVDSGVVFVVSAGNRSHDAANDVPAAYDEVITVSALADFDGQPGGAGTPTCRDDQDDSFASFSNYGADVDLLAPGVCIESTWKQGGYNTISGTSMAAPHVTGTVALYVAAHGGRDVDGNGIVDGADVDLIRSALVGAGLPQLDACGLATFDDPDDTPEPIVFANAGNVGGDGSCAPPAPAVADVAITSVSAPDSATPGEVIGVTVTVANATEVAVADTIYVVLSSDNATPDGADDIPIGHEMILGGLAAGQSSDLVFSWNTVGVNAGDHTLTAMHGLNDADATNNSLMAVVTMEDAALPTVHVGNLEKSSTKDGGGTWTAWVRITVHDADEAVLGNARVTGTWDNSGNTPTESATCLTDATGMCEVSYGGIPSKDGSIVFIVDNVTLDGLAYDQQTNHDPEEDSNGTWIRVHFKNTIDYKK